MAKKITTIGGQALMEGIMMVGPTRTAAAFCDENGRSPQRTLKSSGLPRNIPCWASLFIRGIFPSSIPSAWAIRHFPCPPTN